MFLASTCPLYRQRDYLPILDTCLLHIRYLRAAKLERNVLLVLRISQAFDNVDHTFSFIQ